jgi:peptidoglycan/LPS O-acetylase OafA/YrhL
LRIWPIYYLAVLSFVAINLTMSLRLPMGGLVQYLTYTQYIERYWGGQPASFSAAFAHTWSLAVEEQFYLIWPALIVLVGARRLPLLAAVTVFVGVVGRCAWGLETTLLLSRCDGLALGSLLAVLCSDQERLERHSLAWSRAFLLIGAACAGYLGLETYLHVSTPIARAFLGEIDRSRIEGAHLLVWNLLFTALVGTCVLQTGHRRLALLREPWLRYVGKISYGLYLYHYLSFIFLKYASAGADVSAAAVLAAGAGTFVLAGLSWRFIEAPILAWKSRFPYRKQGSADARSATTRSGALDSSHTPVLSPTREDERS